MVEKFKVLKLKGDSAERVEDEVIQEVPLTILVEDKELVTLLCCPADLDDLVRGFLFTSGLIKENNEIKKIIINEEQWQAYISLGNPAITKDLVFKRLYTSGCGRGTLFYSTADIIGRVKIPLGLNIEPSVIEELTQGFQRKSDTFLKTGGAHSAALADKQKIVIFKEDIGRHNAIDKVIGYALKDGVNFEDKIMLSSGRVSSEVLLKAQKCNIQIIVSQSAPTNQAIKLARDMNITLIGFARGARMNIYSVEERVKIG